MLVEINASLCRQRTWAVDNKIALLNFDVLWCHDSSMVAAASGNDSQSDIFTSTPDWFNAGTSARHAAMVGHGTATLAM